MNPRYIQRNTLAGQPRTEIYGPAYGVGTAHWHSTAGIPVGSHIAGGVFVVNAPSYVMSTFHELGTREDRTVMIPDRLGTNLFHNDGVTDFSADMADAMNDSGEFCFIGVAGNASHTCKDECSSRPCCPIGYNSLQQRNNFWPRLRGAIDIITQGFITVYTEADITVKNCDSLHVRVEVTDPDAAVCQMIGGVTNIADAGTQPLNLDHRIETGAKAGEALMIELR